MTLSLIASFFFTKCSAGNKMHSNHNRFTHSRFRLFAATPGEIKVKKSWRGKVADQFWIHSSIPIAEMKDNNRRLSRALNTCKEANRSMYLCYSAAIVLHGYALSIQKLLLVLFFINILLLLLLFDVCLWYFFSSLTCSIFFLSLVLMYCRWRQATTRLFRICSSRHHYIIKSNGIYFKIAHQKWFSEGGRAPLMGAWSNVKKLLIERVCFDVRGIGCRPANCVVFSFLN